MLFLKKFPRFAEVMCQIFFICRKKFFTWLNFLKIRATAYDQNESHYKMVLSQINLGYPNIYWDWMLIFHKCQFKLTSNKSETWKRKMQKKSNNYILKIKCFIYQIWLYSKIENFEISINDVIYYLESWLMILIYEKHDFFNIDITIFLLLSL